MTYELELLGAVDLRPEGRAGVRLPQPKRLALLSYLLLSRPRGYRTRDELLAMFWPESDHASGRASLRKAVHALRKVLGRRAIESSGERLRVCPGRISCDAVRFEEELDDDRLREAMELYRGDLLAGFHVSGIPAFERWVAMERQRLRRRALETAVMLANRASAAGDTDEACRRALLAVRVEPFDETTGRWAASLLARLGQRTAAIRVLELLIRRLEDEWEVTPSAATTELAEAIRNSPRPAAGSAPEAARNVDSRPREPAVAASVSVGPGRVGNERPDGGASDGMTARHIRAAASRARAGPDRTALVRWALIGAAVVMLVASATSLTRLPLTAARPASDPPRMALLRFEPDFPADSSVAGALTDLIRSNVASFPDFEVTATSEAVTSANADRPAAAEAVAIETATGAAWIVRGRVSRAGGRLLASVDVWDGRRDEWTGPVRAEAPADSLVRLADRLTARLVAGRNTVPGALGYSDLHEGSTSSTAALREFLGGERYFRRGQWPEAALRYWAALEHDSAFAMAYFRLAETRGYASRADVIRLYRTALAFPERLRARDRSLIRGAMLSAQRHRAAVDTLRALTARHPFDAAAWYQLGAAYFHVGRRVLITPDDYRRALSRAVELDPAQVLPYLHLIEDAFAREDEGRARELVHGLRAVAGETTYGIGFAVSSDLAWGDPQTRRGAIEALDTLSPRLRGPLARAMTVIELNPVYRDLLVRIADARLRLTGSDAERDNTMLHLLRVYPRAGQAASGLSVLESRMDMFGSRRNMARSILTWHTLGYRAPGYAEKALTVLRNVDDPTVRERFWMGAWALAAGDSSLYRRLLNGLKEMAAAASTESPAAIEMEPTAPASAGSTAAGSAAVTPPRYVGLVAEGLEALARAKRDADGAIAVLERVHDSREPEITDDGILDYFRYRLGQLYLETGRPALALRYFRAQNHHADLYVALLELEQGRALSAMGRHDDARVHYSRFAEWWKECDPGLRDLRDEAIRALEGQAVRSAADRNRLDKSLKEKA